MHILRQACEAMIGEFYVRDRLSITVTQGCARDLFVRDQDLHVHSKPRRDRYVLYSETFTATYRYIFFWPPLINKGRSKAIHNNVCLSVVCMWHPEIVIAWRNIIGFKMHRMTGHGLDFYDAEWRPKVQGLSEQWQTQWRYPQPT